jgi:signal recognition particle receptor subunit alpha
VEELLETLKTLFVQLFEPFLVDFVRSLHAISAGKAAVVDMATSWDFAKVFEKWDKIFDKVLKGLEDKASQVKATALPSAQRSDEIK